MKDHRQTEEIDAWFALSFVARLIDPIVEYILCQIAFVIAREFC